MPTDVLRSRRLCAYEGSLAFSCWDCRLARSIIEFYILSSMNTDPVCTSSPSCRLTPGRSPREPESRRLKKREHPPQGAALWPGHQEPPRVPLVKLGQNLTRCREKLFTSSRDEGLREALRRGGKYTKTFRRSCQETPGNQGIASPRRLINAFLPPSKHRAPRGAAGLCRTPDAHGLICRVPRCLMEGDDVAMELLRTPSKPRGHRWPVTCDFPVRPR